MTQTFRLVDEVMEHRVSDHYSELLPNGKVLIGCGFDYVNGVSYVHHPPRARLFDPVSEQFKEISMMNFARSTENNGAAIMDSGNVLFAGGWPDSIQRAELYIMAIDMKKEPNTYTESPVMRAVN